MAENIYYSEYIPIPRVFRSDLTNDLLAHCATCEMDLLQDGRQYLIEKAFKRDVKANLDHTIFEYAICSKCAERLHNSISAGSKANISTFINRRVDMVARRERLMETHGSMAEAWLENCLITNRKISECTEYQVFCQCDGPDMLFSNLPYALSGEAIEIMQELLSAETKEELDRFTDDILGLPPDLKELFEDRPVLML